jgi:hypothetical protein
MLLIYPSRDQQVALNTSLKMSTSLMFQEIFTELIDVNPFNIHFYN